VRIAALEKEMYRLARELEFEAAAKVRDEIADLRRDGFELPDSAPTRDEEIALRS
jgi:excinuclease UvrABC helicase subunit UvrB